MRTINVKPWGKGQGAFVTINADDFDPNVHEPLEGELVEEDDSPAPADQTSVDAAAELAVATAALEEFRGLRDTLDAKIAELTAAVAERDEQIVARDHKIAELTAALEAAVVAAAVGDRPDDADPGVKVRGATADGQQLPPASKHDYSDEAHARSAKLTVAEIQADLTAMTVDFDPRAPKADLLALRNAERQKRGEPIVGVDA